MVKRHLKSLAAPKSWPIKRKELKFVARPIPGPHKLDRGITLNLLLKGLLKYANTTREVKKILHSNKVLINKRARKDHRFPVGLFDLIEIPELDEHYTLIINKKGKFALARIEKGSADVKLYKITNKTILKGNKVQLNLFDGWNMVVGKGDFKAGDSVLFNLSKKTVEKHIKFEKGAQAYITGGKYVGNVATIEGSKDSVGSQPGIVKLKKDKTSFETLKEYIFVFDSSVYQLK